MRALITGHTGFKGGWLALYLAEHGDQVAGFGRMRTTGPSFYEAAGVRRRLAAETIGDVRDLPALRAAIRAFRPAVVYHLAARAIVGESIGDPLGAIGANVLGTTTVLEAVRLTPNPPLLVVATSDKVYWDDGRQHAYREGDRLGGLDPYGASKAMCELAVASYRRTYGLQVETVRCGNVIGGGDWGAGRLVPNCLRALERGAAVALHPTTRTFVHVLDAVAGYAMAPEWLAETGLEAVNLSLPYSNDVQWVGRRVLELCEASELAECLDRPAPRQTRHLGLDPTRALELGWRPKWEIGRALESAVAWHRAWKAGADMELVTLEQIKEWAA